MLTNLNSNQGSESDVLSNNLVTVRFAQPILAKAAENQHSDMIATEISTQSVSIQTLAPTLATQLEQVRWINPTLAADISLIREPIEEGVPRQQITVPISPTLEITDEILFEAATGAKFYLPRYRVAERNQQVQVALSPSAQGWALTIQLEKYPAPILQEAARSAQELSHSISVILQHRLMPGNLNGGQKELIFQEITAAPEGPQAVLQLATIAERDLLYQVLTNLDYAAVLTIRRTTQVGIPLSETARTASEIVSSGTGTLRGTWTFSFDTGSEGGTGDVWWEQETDILRQLVPKGNAQMVNLGVRDFNAIALSELQSLAYSTAPIDGSLVRWRRVRKQVDRIDRIESKPWPSDRPRRLGPLISPSFISKPLISKSLISSSQEAMALRPINDDQSPPIIDINDDEEISPNRTNLLIYGDVFAVRTQAGNFAKVQVLAYGYDLQIQWVTYSPQREPLFRPVTRVLDGLSDRNPFVFPPALHPYIFSSITGNSTAFKLDWRPVNGHSYYQDPAERHVFYYLPDSFKLVRQPESPHHPKLSIQFQPIGNADNMQVLLAYWAYPEVKASRLAAAASELRKKVPEPLPSGISGVVFEPLVASDARLSLGLPGPDGALVYQERPEVLIDLRAGFCDSRTLSLEAFQAIYDAIFSTTTQLFQGNVKVNLPDGHTEIIPFIAQMNDLVGETIDHTQGVDAASGAILVTLKNAIESPIRVKQLSANVVSEQGQVDGMINNLSVALPIDLLPNQEISFAVTPVGAIAANPKVVLTGCDIEILADPKAIWDAIVLPQSTMTYKREIAIKTTAGVFGSRIQVISIDLKLGTAIDFVKDSPPEKLSVAASIVTPIRDLILHESDSGTYEYRSLVILANNNKVEDSPGQWRSASSESLWITNTELPPLP